MSNESQFEIVGYFEEIFDVASGKCLGTRRTEKQSNRIQGSGGEVFFTITEPIELQKGHKFTRVKASVAKPVKLMSRYLPLCGRMKWKPFDSSSNPTSA